jgi:cytochrome c556
MWTVLAVAALATTLALTSAAGTEAIKARQAAMEEVGEAIGALAAIAKKEAPFDPAAVKSSAGTIADRLKKAADLFPEGSGAGDVETWAKPEIWSDRENFDKGLETAHAAAVAMQSVTEEAAFGPALGALGNGCKSCHDAYRRPKK